MVIMVYNMYFKCNIRIIVFIFEAIAHTDTVRFALFEYVMTSIMVTFLEPQCFFFHEIYLFYLKHVLSRKESCEEFLFC